MQSSFVSTTWNVTALLGRSSYPSLAAQQVIVPPFQRGFSWEKKHISTFWDDFESFHENVDKKGAPDTYFLGPIVILPEADHITLLDGQQRLVTLTITIAAIRDIARQVGGQAGGDLARDLHRDYLMVDEDAGEWALTLGDLDGDYFRTNVQEDPPSGSVNPTVRSHRLIRQAKTYLVNAVESRTASLGSQDAVKALKKLAKTATSRLMLVAIQVQSEEEAFVIFETLNDRGLRLAVPDLVLNHLMRSAPTTPSRNAIRSHWNDVTENIGFGKVNTFIRHLWVSYYGDVKSQGLYREIRERLAADKIKSLDFAATCALESSQYAAIHVADATVLGKDAVPHVVAIRQLRDDRPLPLLLSGLSVLDETQFVRLARCAIAVLVRHSLLAKLNPLELETAFYKAARELRSGSGASSKAALKPALEILQKINPADVTIATAVGNGVHLNKSQAVYILKELARVRQSPTKAIKLDRVSLEHIFPQNATPVDWLQHAELVPHVWNLGNLTLIEPKYNKDCGNEVYASKCPYYSKSEILLTNDIPAKWQDWDAQAIGDRATSLTGLIKQAWPAKL